MDVKTICLGVLMLGDQSGYEIRKQFQEGPFAHFHQAGYGSIYPALGQLLSDGLVDCVEEEQSGKPDKKVYSLTGSGREALRKALHKQPAPDRVRSEYMFMLFFAELLDNSHLQSIYDDYLNGFKAHVAFMETLDNTGIPKGRRFARALGLNYYRTMVSFLEEHRHDLLGADVVMHPVSDKAEHENPQPQSVGSVREGNST